MAQPTNDASNDGNDSTTESIHDRLNSLKTDMLAEERGGRRPTVEDAEEEDKSGDEEADDATDIDDDTDTDDSADDSQDDSADDDDGADDKGKQESDFRFSQFKGEKGTADEYIKNLENGYLNSSQEAIKIRDERDGFQRQVDAIKQAAGKDPEFGEKLLSLLNAGGGDNSSSGDGLDDPVTQSSNNPFLVHAQTEWNEKNELSVKDFTDANPEVLTDPKINADVKRWARVFTKQVFDDEQRLITTGEAMERAFRYLGLEDKRQAKQSLVDGMKKNAAPTRPQAAKKKSSGKSGNDTKQFSDQTLSFADKMGISKERLVKSAKR